MKITIWILAILLILQLIFIGIYNSTYDISKSINLTGDVIRTLATLGTLGIALLLYDRFGVRKKIIEDRVYLVLDLIKEVKSLSVRAIVDPGKGPSNRSYFPRIQLSNQMQIYKKDKEIMNSLVVFEVLDFDEGLKDINKILNNSLLPTEIREKLNFLEFTIPSTEIDKNERHIKICFTKDVFLNPGDKHWFRINNVDMKFADFVSNFESFFAVCEKWINKHVNLNIKLNI